MAEVERGTPSGPSEHLRWSELACRDGSPYPREWRSDRAKALAAAFEAVRAEYGGPINILSAYRSPEHNRAIGGARFSQHVEGRALDLSPSLSPRSLPRLIACVEQIARQGMFIIRGIGVYPSFVHMDIRNTDRIVRWTGGRPSADLKE